MANPFEVAVQTLLKAGTMFCLANVDKNSVLKEGVYALLFRRLRDVFER
jgi:hypothetical protein